MDTRLRLEKFTVHNLFGEFNHEIRFNLNQGITALIGPNGLGKTVCLRLINAFFQRQWSFFASTEFDKIEFRLSDGSLIHVHRVPASDSQNEVSDSMGIIFDLFDSSGDRIEQWAPRNIDDKVARAMRVESYLPFLTRSSPRSWTHDYTGQSYTYHEVLDTFRDQIPETILRSMRVSASAHIDKIVSRFDCHLIETQRLLVFQQEEYRRGTQSMLAISQKADRLKTIIERELGRYASTSQSLDRTFPRRVLQMGPQTGRIADLGASLKALDRMRNGLSDAGLLVSEEGDAIPSAVPEDDAIARVLGIYVEDTRRKLQVLEVLRTKILLFKRLIDNRFHPKSIAVNAAKGFEVQRGSELAVPLEKLSSGEQHQLVLFFELLFELKENALILIDEPELSLHVGWQKKFISALIEIIKLNAFDVLLATHSPQLIGEWEDLVVEIGDVDPI